MRKEKITLSVVAALIGILVAVVGFFFYQSSKQVNPSEIKEIKIETPGPTPQSNLFLVIDRPIDEEVVNKRIIAVSGKTVPGAKIVVLTQSNEEAAIPARDGSFSTDITLDKDENIIEVSAITPNGEIIKVKKVVTYTTEDF